MTEFAYKPHNSVQTRLKGRQGVHFNWQQVKGATIFTKSNSFSLCSWVGSYGRVYTTDPYHALAPAAAAYGVGAMVRKHTASPHNHQLETHVHSVFFKEC